MILNKDTVEAYRWCVYDCAGTIIPYVLSFDTETCQIELGINAGNTLLKHIVDGKPQHIYVTFILPGAYAVQKPEELVQQAMEEHQASEATTKD